MPAIDFRLCICALLALVLNHAEARPPNDCATGSNRNAQLTATLRNSCEIELAANHCAEFLEKNPDAASKMRDCTADPSQSNFALGCADGFSEIADTLGSKAGGLWSKLIHADPEYLAEKEAQDRFENICQSDKSLTIKRQLVRDAWLEGVSSPVTDTELRGISCAKLMRDVQTRQNFAIAQELVEKLDDPEFKRQWSEARRNLYASFENQVTALAEGIDIRLKCYNPRAQTAIECKMLAAVLAGLATKRLASVLDEAGIKRKKQDKDRPAESERDLKPKAQDQERYLLKSRLTPQKMPTKTAKFGENLTLGKIEVSNSEGKVVGTLEYAYFPDVKKIKLEDVEITEKGKGPSKAAYAEMVKKSPDATHIETQLVDDNENVVRKFLDEGLSCVEALKQSPAYKAGAALGFTKIIESSCDPDNFFLSVGR